MNKLFSNIEEWETDFLYNIGNWLKGKTSKYKAHHLQVIEPHINDYVDSRIYLLIWYLNDLGFKTKACCEGFVNFEKSYISFPIDSKEKVRKLFTNINKDDKLWCSESKTAFIIELTPISLSKILNELTRIWIEEYHKEK